MNRKAAADAFQAALLEHDAAALYERAPVGYLSTTPDGVIVTVNGTFLTWTGFTRDDLVGRRTFSEILTPGGRIYHETHYAPMLQMQGSAREIAFEIVRADGSRMPALVNSVLERDPGGAPVVVRTAIFDATERREYERELLRAKERAESSEARAQLLARTLQQSLIPPAPPDIPGLDLAAAYRPAGKGDEVGGDFYDIFEIGPGDWVVAIGDVCGKGVDAAVVTSLARGTIRAAAVGRPRPRDVLATLNQVLLGHHIERFCTITLLRIRASDAGWSVTVAAGGHPLPILDRVGSEPSTFGVPGQLLGVLDEPEITDTEVLLQPSDAVVLFTDGVTEGRRGREFYGEDRLHRAVVVSRGSATTLAGGILRDVLEFQAGNPRDDIALVVIRVP